MRFEGAPEETSAGGAGAWVDAHCHLSDGAWTPSARARFMASESASGVGAWVMAGVDAADWAAQKRLSALDPRVSLAFGTHPWSAATAPVGDALRDLESALSSGPRPVAIGELGLDRTLRWRSGFDDQDTLFRRQLALARERDFPLVLHMVRAIGPTLSRLKNDGIPKAGGMVHGFTGAPEVATECLRLGLHLSYGPTILNPSAKRARASAAMVPAGRILVETDAMGPDGGGRTLKSVLTELAAIRGVGVNEIGRETAMAARTLFGLALP